ncbi:copper homeostasis periplasmic binding protein CopC [Herbaspirillum chlorophenolicum]|uniref:copper homeostasis periplasmic binding protein CopC n=1 Tax=Herbaspirillum chlorophenolicum TaxID=211589 RepID=UPI001E43B7EA|nr:copper homeostasis periplasmic binding protein CopC [Herbaspirillum chlorophenolicum]
MDRSILAIFSRNDFQRNPMSRLTRFFIIALVSNLFVLSQAWAHAHLKSAAPADKTAISSPPDLNLAFSEGLNLKFSGIKLIGPDKQEIKLGEAMLMDGGKTLMVPVQGQLPAGAYTVEWHALSVDGHKTNGSYGFTVTP